MILSTKTKIAGSVSIALLSLTAMVAPTVVIGDNSDTYDTAISQVQNAQVLDASYQPSAPYNRTEHFGQAWKDVDHNGCDTRNDMLSRDLTNPVLREGSNCVVATGTLKNDVYSGDDIQFVRGEGSCKNEQGSYNGSNVKFIRYDENGTGTGCSTAIQIDHIIPLSLAWRSGAEDWTQAQREAFANDPDNLIASDGALNNQKSDKSPSQWIPDESNGGSPCWYAVNYANVVGKYNLPISSADKTTLLDTLGECKAMNKPLRHATAVDPTDPPTNPATPTISISSDKDVYQVNDIVEWTGTFTTPSEDINKLSIGSGFNISMGYNVPPQTDENGQGIDGRITIRKVLPDGAEQALNYSSCTVSAMIEPVVPSGRTPHRVGLMFTKNSDATTSCFDPDSTYKISFKYIQGERYNEEYNPLTEDGKYFMSGGQAFVSFNNGQTLSATTTHKVGYEGGATFPEDPNNPGGDNPGGGDTPGTGDNPGGETPTPGTDPSDDPTPDTDPTDSPTEKPSVAPGTSEINDDGSITQGDNKVRSITTKPVVSKPLATTGASITLWGFGIATIAIIVGTLLFFAGRTNKDIPLSDKETETSQLLRP